MNEDDFLRSLAHAPPTAAPLRDVTDWVLRDIHLAATERSHDRLWKLAAITACTLALIAALVAIPAWQSFDNPLTNVTTLEHPVNP